MKRIEVVWIDSIGLNDGGWAEREERQKLTSALSRKPADRSEADDAAIAYSSLEGGTGAGCSSCGCRKGS